MSKLRLRFVGDNLVDETGKIYEVNKEELVKACGDSDYSTLSVAGIICEKVAKVTKCEISSYACRKSSLFETLEKIVTRNEAYIEKKTKRIETAEKIRRNREIFNSSKKIPIAYCEKKERQFYRSPYKKRVPFE